MNQIHLKNLKYLKTTKTLYVSNINVAPTVFIGNAHAEQREVYVVYTNQKDEEQTYIINPGTLTDGSLAGKHGEIHCIKGNQLYSGSGKGAQFDINNAYIDCHDPFDYDYWYEIDGETPPFTDIQTCPTNMPADAMCVTVPAYSCGYFVFTYDPTLRVGEMEDMYQIFPNPASSGVVIQQIDYTNTDISALDINIYSAAGNLVSSKKVEEGEMVDISQLPVGVYTIIINSDVKRPEMETLVKMK